MNAFIIAALTADGLIAKDKAHAAAWTSKEDKKRFVALTKEAGVVVMGSRTFSTLSKPLKDRLNVVYTRTPEKFAHLSAENVLVTDNEPAELLAELEGRGFKSAAICGGAEIYTLFMKAGVVTTLHLTTEPLVFGQGIGLFSEPIDFKLALHKTISSETGTVFSEYGVIK